MRYSNNEEEQLQLPLWEASSPALPKESTIRKGRNQGKLARRPEKATLSTAEAVARWGVKPEQCQLGEFISLQDGVALYHKGRDRWEVYRRDTR